MSQHLARLPLAIIAAGSDVRLAEFDAALDPLQREQLLAYGLALGSQLRVLQQHPMTLILADEIELALEHGVARQLWVEMPVNTREAAAGA